LGIWTGRLRKKGGKIGIGERLNRKVLGGGITKSVFVGGRPGKGRRGDREKCWCRHAIVSGVGDMHTDHLMIGNKGAKGGTEQEGKKRRSTMQVPGSINTAFNVRGVCGSESSPWKGNEMIKERFQPHVG